VRKNSSVSEINCQEELDKELARLKHVLGVVGELKLKWIPSKSLSKSGKELSGEVRREVVYIFESDCDEAVKTLRHEVIDYLVSQSIEPYKEVTNRLIKMVNEDAYKRKEKVVEALSRLIEITGD
jgi:hypothetical protein